MQDPLPISQDSNSNRSQTYPNSIPSSPQTYISDMKHMGIKSIPLSVAIFFFTSNIFFEFYFISQSTTNNDIISAYSLANAFVLLLSMAFVSALNNGLVARISLAFGQGDIRQCGLLLHKGLAINILITTPLIFPLLYIKRLLLSLGASEEISSNAESFAYARLPGAILSIISSTIGAIFNGCKIMTVPSIIFALGSMLTLLLDWIFLLKLDMGLEGVGLANSISTGVSVVLGCMYIILLDPIPGAFFWPSKESFEGIWALFKYEFTVGAMTWLDFGSGQLTSMISASFTSIQLSGMTVSGNLNLILIPFGVALSVTTSSYIGSAVGAREGQRAKGILKASLILAFGSSVVLMIVGKSLDDVLVKLLASDDEVIEYALILFNWGLWLIPLNSVVMILNATVRTVGLEREGIWTVGLCDFGVFLPGCVVFAKSLDMGGLGFTLAGAISNGVKGVVFGMVLKRRKWEEKIREFEMQENESQELIKLRREQFE